MIDKKTDYITPDAMGGYAVEIIRKTFDVASEEIKQVQVMKKGMTNRSFSFKINSKRYIIRVPGEGTENLINRKNEAAVYHTIKGLGICDDPVYIDPGNGYKITSFLDNVRTCDIDNEDDLRRCMEKLRSFHSLKLTVPHTFDIWGQIQFYESLWNKNSSEYPDYEEVKRSVFSMKDFVDTNKETFILTHIDAVPDNFLFYHTKDNGEELQLTDWEYAGMQDPHVDIAMFCIYSLYNKKQSDKLIDIYFDNKCDDPTRAKIYCYMSASSLLWSNWCEYKKELGVEFGEYGNSQYNYARDYYSYAKEVLK
ncbi:MAG: phosphotransferase family protein [Lachnospiraceae bacterium]|nr:phosphotransferase family protein [Lachnospiraceae bacterium]